MKPKSSAKVVRFSDDDSCSYVNDNDDEGFVTKRTFELLEQDEPFLEKQMKMLVEVGHEHIETWKESLKEITEPLFNETDPFVDFLNNELVEPFRQTAVPCVDGMKDLIHFGCMLPEIAARRRQPLIMVGGPVPAIYTKFNMTDTESLLSEEYSLLSDTEHSEKSNRKLEERGHKRNESVSSCEFSMYSKSHGTSHESEKNSDEESIDACDESSKGKSNSHHTPSGTRPESPIKLFSSQDLSESDGEEFPAGGSERVHSFLPSPPKNPSVVDDYRCEGMEDDGLSAGDPLVRVQDDHEESKQVSPLKCDEERAICDEERDQPPSAMELVGHFSQDSQDYSSVDFSPIETLSGSNSVPFSRSLLYSMRSRNRDIDNLLAELPTKYTFGVSGEDTTADASPMTTSMVSSLLKSFSEQLAMDHVPKQPNRPYFASHIDNEHVQEHEIAQGEKSNQKKEFKFISVLDSKNERAVIQEKVSGRPLLNPRFRLRQEF
jgi:hypothetical protein